MIKAIPLVIISIPPFAIILVFTLMWVVVVNQPTWYWEYDLLTVLRDWLKRVQIKYILGESCILPKCLFFGGGIKWMMGYLQPLIWYVSPLLGRCLFPRQLLIRHLWTPQQQQDFQRLYHEQRCRHRENILKGVAWSIPHIKEWTLRSHLLTLISKVNHLTL